MGLDAGKMKMLFDCHINIPRDTENTQEYCAQAKQQGLAGCCLIHPFSLSEQPLFKKPVNSAKAYADIQLLTGLEIEFSQETHASMAMLTAGLSPDYVINSVHSVNGKSLRAMEYYTHQSRSEAYSNYLECVFDSLDAAFEYSVLGHITYVSKYAYYPSPSLEWREFPDILDNILMRAVFMGKGLELTWGAKTLMPSLSVLKRYRELGGELITLGSGAQAPEQVGTHLQELRDAAVNCGFQYYAVFKQMHPQMYPL